jgi:hypothetical protein
MIDHKKFNEWASQVYENTQYNESAEISYFDKGDSDPRTLFECILASVDSNINESLESMDFDFVQIDSILNYSIVESINNNNEDALNEVFDFVKKSIANALDKSSEVINKGIQIGADVYSSVKAIGKKLKDVIAKVFEKIKKFLSLTWDWAKTGGKSAAAKIKEFAKKEIKGTAMSSLSTILHKGSADTEFEEAQKDVKGAVGKINGKDYKLDPAAGELKLKDTISDLEDADSEDIDEVVIQDLVDITESTVDKMFTSIKGLLIEGHTLNELEEFVNTEDELNENADTKKGLVGWMIEAIGFALNPFAKIYELAIKSTMNGMFMIVSSVARGGIKNAYKYVIMGTLVSLGYHIIHGAQGVAHHFSVHEAEASNNLKISDGKRMFQFEDAKKMLSVGLGGVFTHCLSSFFPIVALILEILIVSIASFELCIAICESAQDLKDSSACKVVMNVEHALEQAF